MVGVGFAGVLLLGDTERWGVVFFVVDAFAGVGEAFTGVGDALTGVGEAFLVDAGDAFFVGVTDRAGVFLAGVGERAGVFFAGVGERAVAFWDGAVARPRAGEARGVVLPFLADTGVAERPLGVAFLAEAERPRVGVLVRLGVALPGIWSGRCWLVAVRKR